LGHRFPRLPAQRGSAETAVVSPRSGNSHKRSPLALGLSPTAHDQLTLGVVLVHNSVMLSGANLGGRADARGLVHQSAQFVEKQDPASRRRREQSTPGSRCLKSGEFTPTFGAPVKSFRGRATGA
jgi:hypothetical protein